MTDRIHIPLDLERIADICRRWKITELSLFGSVLRDDFRPDSDVDVLVSFDGDAEWSLWDIVDLREELVALFGRDVDIVEKEGLRNPIRRDTIMRERRTLYAA